MTRKNVVLDPAVLAIIEGSGAPVHQAKRKRRRRQTNLALDPRIAQALKQIAAAEGVSPAGAASLLITTGVRAYIAGEVSFGEHTRASRSPAFEWVVEEQGLDELMFQLAAFLNGRD